MGARSGNGVIQKIVNRFAELGLPVAGGQLTDLAKHFGREPIENVLDFYSKLGDQEECLRLFTPSQVADHIRLLALVHAQSCSVIALEDGKEPGTLDLVVAGFDRYGVGTELFLCLNLLGLNPYKSLGYSDRPTTRYIWTLSVEGATSPLREIAEGLRSLLGRSFDVRSADEPWDGTLGAHQARQQTEYIGLKSSLELTNNAYYIKSDIIVLNLLKIVDKEEFAIIVRKIDDLHQRVDAVETNVLREVEATNVLRKVEALEANMLRTLELLHGFRAELRSLLHRNDALEELDSEHEAVFNEAEKVVGADSKARQEAEAILSRLQGETITRPLTLRLKQFLKNRQWGLPCPRKECAHCASSPTWQKGAAYSTGGHMRFMHADDSGRWVTHGGRTTFSEFVLLDLPDRRKKRRESV